MAKDLDQEVIIQLWKSYDRFDGKSKVSTCIYRVALNVAISNYRKISTRKKYEAPFKDDFIEIVLEDESDNNEEVAILHMLIGELDELNRAVMILYLDGNSYEEIAEVMSISSSNVGTKINRIKKQLKKQFESLEA